MCYFWKKDSNVIKGASLGHRSATDGPLISFNYSKLAHLARLSTSHAVSIPDLAEANPSYQRLSSTPHDPHAWALRFGNLAVLFRSRMPGF